MNEHKIVNGVRVDLTESEIAERVVEADTHAAEQAANRYKEDRLADLPSIGDQLDMIYWDKVNGTNLWEDLITANKAKHPKP